MAQIKFRFDRDKLINALAYIASNGVEDLSKMKAAKLLFFADKYHLLNYARPIIGDQYYCLDNGPIPSYSLNLMNNAIGSCDDDTVEVSATDRAVFLANLTVERNGSKHPVFRVIGKPDTDVFSQSDLEALDFVIANYGHMTASQLRDLSHLEPAWKAADRGRFTGRRAEIPYQLFFSGEDKADELIAIIEDDQENRDFAEYLSDREPTTT